MKPLIFALCVVFAFGGLSAQKPVWQPSPGHTQVPIWPGRAPDPQPVAGPEFATTPGKEWLVAGRPAVGVSNVSRPTMTVYSPTGKNTGVAVVVFPGGGYQGLAIDLEGTEVCDWLAPKEIACVLLKYRVTDVGPYPKSGPYPESPMANREQLRTAHLHPRNSRRTIASRSPSPSPSNSFATCSSRSGISRCCGHFSRQSRQREHSEA